MRVRTLPSKRLDAVQTCNFITREGDSPRSARPNSELLSHKLFLRHLFPQICVSHKVLEAEAHPHCTFASASCVYHSKWKQRARSFPACTHVLAVFRLSSHVGLLRQPMVDMSLLASDSQFTVCPQVQL